MYTMYDMYLAGSVLFFSAIVTVNSEIFVSFIYPGTVSRLQASHDYTMTTLCIRETPKWVFGKQ